MKTKTELRSKILDALNSMSEPEYQRFSSSLLPGVDNILGVRLPKLRKYAKELIKSYGLSYLDEALSYDNEYMEEILLQGMLIGNLKVKGDLSLTDIQSYIKNYVPKINNWSTCDSFCAGLKITGDYPTQMWDFINSYHKSKRDYDVRFALVMIINYYIQDNYIEEVYEIFNKIGRDWNNKPHTDQGVYYVKMALAWAISICYVHYPQKTLRYLEKMHNESSILDEFTYNKALQKIIESRCVSADEKAQIKLMKRKNK